MYTQKHSMFTVWELILFWNTKNVGIVSWEILKWRDICQKLLMNYLVYGGISNCSPAACLAISLLWCPVTSTPISSSRFKSAVAKACCISLSFTMCMWPTGSGIQQSFNLELNICQLQWQLSSLHHALGLRSNTSHRYWLFGQIIPGSLTTPVHKSTYYK